MMSVRCLPHRSVRGLGHLGRWGAVGVCLGIFALPTDSIAAPCDAHYTFDGSLADASGNGYTGQMISADGEPRTPSFAEGRIGSALRLDGASSMRAFVDLNFEICPQVTIAAWVQISPDGSNHWLVSSGSGQGPGIRVSAAALVAEGTGNGISETGVVRDAADFFFVAGVWDYVSGTHTLYWRNRSTSAPMPVSGYLYPPEEAIWVGALNDSLSEPAEDALIDDLRIYSRALTPDEIRALLTGNAPGF